MALCRRPFGRRWSCREWAPSSGFPPPGRQPTGAPAIGFVRPASRIPRKSSHPPDQARRPERPTTEIGLIFPIIPAVTPIGGDDTARVSCAINVLQRSFAARRKVHDPATRPLPEACPPRTSRSGVPSQSAAGKRHPHVPPAPTPAGAQGPARAHRPGYGVPPDVVEHPRPWPQPPTYTRKNAPRPKRPCNPPASHLPEGPRRVHHFPFPLSGLDQFFQTGIIWRIVGFQTLPAGKTFMVVHGKGFFDFKGRCYFPLGGVFCFFFYSFLLLLFRFSSFSFLFFSLSFFRPSLMFSLSVLFSLLFFFSLSLR